MEAIRVLLGILDQRLVENVSLKETLTPLLSVLTAVSRQNRIIRKYLREEVLPPLGYVGTEKPEDSKTTRGRLIRHLTSAVHDLKVVIYIYCIIALILPFNYRIGQYVNCH